MEPLSKEMVNRRPEFSKHVGNDDCCCCFEWIWNFFKRNILLVLTVLGIIIGFALGFGLREVRLSPNDLMWIGMVGELYFRLLKLMILPLIVCSVISGTASVDAKSNGKISALAFIYIMVTNSVSGVVGILLSLLILPSNIDVHSPSTRNITNKIETGDVFADLLRNIMPDNMVEATFQQTQTQFLRESNNTNKSFTVGNVDKTMGTVRSVNVLGLIFTCMILGMAANGIKEKGKTFIAFFASATDIVMAVLRWILCILFLFYFDSQGIFQKCLFEYFFSNFVLTPVGIASLIAVSIASVRDVTTVFAQLGMFVTAVTTGIALLHIIILPGIFFLIVRQNPFKFIFNIAEGWFIAFAATSTAAAMPELIHGCENKNKIDRRIVRFVIPFCVTLNSNGSAVYIATAAMFVSSMSGTALATGDIVMIGVLVAFLSLALPSVPSSAIVALVTILTSLNISTNGVALLFAVEWYLDRIRTVCNATSHTICCAVTYKLCGVNLQDLPDNLPEGDIENYSEEITKSPIHTVCEKQNSEMITEGESSKL